MTFQRGGSSSRVKQLLSGFAELNDAERSEFVDRLNQYYEGPPQRRETLRKEFKAGRLQLGPTGTTCGCCGR